MKDAATDGVPIGTIMAFAGPSSKVGIGKLKNWFLCDGREMNAADGFEDLFEAIGTNWGGTGASNFFLPDLRGYFLRGVDHGAGVDPDSKTRVEGPHKGNSGDAVGSIQSDEFKNHNHSLNKWNRSFKGSDDSDKPYDDQGSVPDHTGSVGGNETRPKNAYVEYIIKVKND